MKNQRNNVFHICNKIMIVELMKSNGLQSKTVFQKTVSTDKWYRGLFQGPFLLFRVGRKTVIFINFFINFKQITYKS